MDKYENSQELLDHYQKTIELYAEEYCTQISDDTIYNDLINEGQLAVLEALITYESGTGKNFDDYVVENIKIYMRRCIKEITVNHPHINERKLKIDIDPTGEEVAQKDEIEHIGNNKILGIHAIESLRELRERIKEKDKREQRYVSDGREKTNIIGIKELRDKRDARMQKEDDFEERKAKH